MDDQLWHRSIKTFERMWGKKSVDLTEDELTLWRSISMGVMDANKEFDNPWPSSIRAMRHSGIIGDALWKLLEKEKARVSLILVAYAHATSF